MPKQEDKLAPTTSDCPKCGVEGALTVHMCGLKTDWTECTECGAWWNPDLVYVGGD